MHRLFTHLCLALFACSAVACEDEGPDNDADAETGSATTEADTEAPEDTTGQPGTAGAGVGTLAQPSAGEGTGETTTGAEETGDTGDTGHNPTTLGPKLGDVDR